MKSTGVRLKLLISNSFVWILWIQKIRTLEYNKCSNTQEKKLRCMLDMYFNINIYEFGLSPKKSFLGHLKHTFHVELGDVNILHAPSSPRV